MQSIGERLEEARKRRGISIREASEATKIRGDFLLNFENNQFDVGLPDIYVRGFLRNYSSFLKIDPEKIVTDFNATILGETKSGRRDARELFGRMELPERPRPSVEGSAPAAPTAPRRRVEEPPELQGRGGGGRANPEYGNTIKVGLIIVAGIVSLLVIVWLVMAIINTAQGPSKPAPERPPANVSTAPEDTIILVAVGDVSVRVAQTADNVVLFDGMLVRGERKPITRRGPVEVRYNPGANLQVEIKGRLNKMTSEGIGRNTIQSATP
jgi:cytoskeleton protein RodZ